MAGYINSISTKNTELDIFSGSGAINIGTDSSSKSITIGSTNIATDVTINAGDTIQVGLGTDASVAIGNGSSLSNTLNIASYAVNIGDNGGAINITSTTDALLQCFPGGAGVNAAEATITEVLLYSLSSSAVGPRITLNATTGVTSITSSDTGTALALSLGSTYVASSLTLNTGSAGITIPSFTHYGVVGITSAGLISDIASGTSGYVLTSTGTGSLPSWQAASGGSSISTLDGDTGSATGTTVTIAGGNNISTTATSSTVTINLINSPSVSGSVTAGTGIIATTGGLTATAGGLTVTAGTITTPFTSYGALVSNTSGVITDAAATSGYVLTGNSGSVPTFQALPSYITWSTVVSPTQTLASGHGYIANDGATLITFLLPTTATVGTLISIQGSGTGLWTVTQNAGQTIHFGAINTTTGTGGSLSSNNQYDSIDLLCITANTDWVVRSAIGTLSYV